MRASNSIVRPDKRYPSLGSLVKRYGAGLESLARTGQAGLLSTMVRGIYDDRDYDTLVNDSKNDKALAALHNWTGGLLENASILDTQKQLTNASLSLEERQVLEESLIAKLRRNQEMSEEDIEEIIYRARYGYIGDLSERMVHAVRDAEFATLQKQYKDALSIFGNSPWLTVKAHGRDIDSISARRAQYIAEVAERGKTNKLRQQEQAAEWAPFEAENQRRLAAAARSRLAL